MLRPTAAVILLALAPVSIIGCATAGDANTKSAEKTQQVELAEKTDQKKADYKSHKDYSKEYSKPGFAAFDIKGRLFVFKTSDTENLDAFLKAGEPAKSVTWIGAGPDRKSLRGVDDETLLAYVALKPGFAAIPHKGRLWVFKDGSDDHKEFVAKGEPAKSVTRIGAGPRNTSIRAVDAETIDAYLGA